MSPQDRPKVIALVLGIIVFLGFALKSLIRPHEEPLSPPAPVAQTAPATTSEGGPDGALAKTAPVTVAYSGVDPFRSVFPTQGGTPAGGNAQRVTENAIKKPPIQDPWFPVPGDNGKNPPLDVPHPAQAEIKVEGVVIDNRGRMAIISSGGKTEFLKIGQKYGDGFYVVSIQPRAVTFSRKGKLLVIEVGSTLGGPAFEQTPPNTRS